MAKTDPPRPRKALGRGLGALIPEPAPSAPAPVPVGPGLLEIDLDLLRPNPLQPRKSFDPEDLADLARSITEQGVITPIVVREREGGYEIIAGERRWRASQLAGLHRIPAVVRNVHRAQALEVALVENIQRSQLNPIEEAHAFQLLVDEFQLKQEDVARRVGKDRTTVTNTLRLLKLAPELQQLVVDGVLTAGHARALLAVTDERHRAQLATRVAREGLNVRALERLARRPPRAPQPPPATSADDVFLRSARERLQKALGTKVKIERSTRGGHIRIEYYSDEELTRLFDRLLKA